MNLLKNYTAKTDQGPWLQINEDAYLIDYTGGLFLILDGFGGSGVGDKIVDLAGKAIGRFYLKSGQDPDATLPFFYEHQYLLESNVLINSLYHAHHLIKKENGDKKLSACGGTSAIGVALSKNRLCLSSTGNCAAYLHRKGTLDYLVRPDGFFSLTQDIRPDLFENLPAGALGLFDDIHLNNSELQIAPGDLILLMTDGVHHLLGKEDIHHIIDEKTSDKKKIESLFHLANSRGNKHNQTTVFLRF